MHDSMQLVIVTGMSGAGKTVAMQSFEDLGYFCVDNMPPALMGKFWELIKESGKIKKVALVIDLRSRAFYEEVVEMIRSLEDENGISAKIVFLDASDEELVARYKETRRSHPLAMDGRVLDGIVREREILNEIKSKATLLIDTTRLSPRQLREEIFHNFETSENTAFHINVMSFGFKYGIPPESDLVFDVRFLPNPYYEMSLRERNGTDPEVRDYVFRGGTADVLMRYLTGMIDFLLPRYIAEGKANLIISIGCTGGKHRSVAITEALSEHLRRKEYGVVTMHRDYQR